MTNELIANMEQEGKHISMDTCLYLWNAELLRLLMIELILDEPALYREVGT